MSDATIHNDIELAIADLKYRRKRIKETQSYVAKLSRQLDYDDRHSEVCQMPGAEKYELELLSLI